MARKTVPQVSFDDQLVLFRFFLNEFKINALTELSEKLNAAEYEGLDEDGRSYFYRYFVQISKSRFAPITPEKLRMYDENICSHTQKIGEKRGGIKWKYFQYVALLFTEMYLDRYFSDKDAFLNELNGWLSETNPANFKPYTLDKLSKLAFMCATGSGKTLIMHVNILQFMSYLKRAQRINSSLSMNKIILLAPNEGLSRQHLEELSLSSIPAKMFEKSGGLDMEQDKVIVIDMNKLKEEGKVKTVSVDSFEQNNLVLVDEGHRGLSGDVWYDYRTRLSAEGFAFEYSATFKQALNGANSRQSKDYDALTEEYGKSIIMDYSYKYFYSDGYGKDYRIYNLKSAFDNGQKRLYLVGCLLSFYQQMKLFEVKSREMREFNIEKPLLVFVGNRVTAPIKKSNLSKAEQELLTDIEEVLVFFDNFLRNPKQSIEDIGAVLREDTGLIDEEGHDLFSQNFPALHKIFGVNIDSAEVFKDILQIVFNADKSAVEPRLCMDNIKQAVGEIGLKVGKYGEYFGVINIGDTMGLLKKCEQKSIVVDSEEFVFESLFRNINKPNSKINILIGSRKFTEGWNSLRVSTMGLINFAKGEGSQAIQLFGRGVRLKGYEGCLKRSRKLCDNIRTPKHIEILETLTIFGVKAQYMEDFKAYLQEEGAPTNETSNEYRIPVISRFDTVKDKRLRIIKLRDGANFKKQAARLVLDKPDSQFLNYLLKNKTIIDCRIKIQSIDSTHSLKLDEEAIPQTLPTEVLPLIDFWRIYMELEEYKSAKQYYNICIVRAKFLDILKADGWYGLIIPKNKLEIDSYAKLETATDYAIMALKSYMDKFFKYKKDCWEAPRLEYAFLDEKDKNFIDEYAISFPKDNATENISDQLNQFILEISETLSKKSGFDTYKKECFQGKLTFLDFPSHLYTPLICLTKSNLKIEVSPVALNSDEMRFIDCLKKYVDTCKANISDKSLYLLRNKSKVGMGFFEAGNFYPDFILWIDMADTQYISFIDPKGLLHIRPDDPKIEFYKTIKELENRIPSTADGKKIVLNSFIMSGTGFGELCNWWSSKGTNVDREYLEARNVYTLDDKNCIDSMIKKILK